MHVRVRSMGGGAAEAVVVVPSRLSRVDALRSSVAEKFGVAAENQRLFYGGKLLENGYTLHDYGVKLNDVIQLMPELPKVDKETKEQKQTAPGHRNATVEYEDATSQFYRIGDLVDTRDESGAWHEGKIINILRPKLIKKVETPKRSPPAKNGRTPRRSESKSPKKKPTGTPSRKINDYFTSPKSNAGNDSKDLNGIEKEHKIDFNEDTVGEDQSSEKTNFIFKVELYDDEVKLESSFSQIRPRARNEIKIENLETGQTVMINYNLEEPSEKGYWYDFTISEVNKLRKNYELIGTLHRGNDVKIDISVKYQEKIYAVETVILIKDRTKEYEKLMVTEIERRSRPLNCTTCKDVTDAKCKDCGCNACAGKNKPDQIILCDECNMGYHLFCLDPPLEQLPDDDWYCPDCRRDSNGVIAPGKGKQVHKKNNSKTKRDWGRGMACVGKTQTCTMPANHFGPIPGIEVGMMWRFRIQLSESGVHRPPVSGIHGRDVDGAYSIVLSGGYEDDTDNGFEFTYTGSGGRDLSGNKRTADQSSDQTLTRENRALAKNCAVKDITEDGADAKENWRDGKPVRVVRSYKMKKHFPEFAPKEGIRYDGIYKVVKYYPETGKSGFRVWKYMLRRDDPNPAPWEKNAKQFKIIYPDGYLEAEAQKQALKDKQRGNGQKRKRILQENNGEAKSSSDDEIKKKKTKVKSDSPPKKKMRTRSSIDNSPKVTTPKNGKTTPKPKTKAKLVEKNSPNDNKTPFTIAASKKSCSPKIILQNENIEPLVITAEEKEAIENDETNKKLWTDCLSTLKTEGKQGLINKVTTLFLCIICQEVASNPVTSSCGHNFCINCLKLAFKSTHCKQCPYCRADLSKDELQVNEMLKIALRTIMPGYDGKCK